jgi:hypothetical protein
VGRRQEKEEEEEEEKIESRPFSNIIPGRHSEDAAEIARVLVGSQQRGIIPEGIALLSLKCIPCHHLSSAKGP